MQRLITAQETEVRTVQVRKSSMPSSIVLTHFQDGGGVTRACGREARTLAS